MWADQWETELVVVVQNECPSKRGEDVCNGMRIFLSKHIFFAYFVQVFLSCIEFFLAEIAISKYQRCSRVLKRFSVILWLFENLEKLEFPKKSHLNWLNISGRKKVLISSHFLHFRHLFGFLKRAIVCSFVHSIVLSCFRSFVLSFSQIFFVRSFVPHSYFLVIPLYTLLLWTVWLAAISFLLFASQPSNN